MTKSQNQFLGIRKLILSNNCKVVKIGIFKNIFPNLLARDNLQLPDKNFTLAQKSFTAETFRAANLSLLKKKKVEKS